jgi:sugar lactone lactonase YvrE
MIDTSGVITTVAGGYGPGAFCGDGGPAAAACLNRPAGVTLDRHGNLFIADSGNNRIREVDAQGVITTVAGKSSPHNCRIGKQATRACLHSPGHVAFDQSGNMYIPDYYSGHVWKVSHSGKLFPFAGGGSGAACGDDGIAATSACLREVTDVAVDGSGSVYITDLLHYKVRRVDPLGTITTIAGNGTYGYCGDNLPATSVCLGIVYGLVVQRAGGVLFSSDDRIMTVDSSGTLRTVAGGASTSEQQYCGDGGPATSACLDNPSGIALDRRGDLFIADSVNERIREVVAPFGP